MDEGGHNAVKQILALSGSLRAASSNTALLQAAALLAPAGVEIALFAGLAALPPFNPDLDTDAPPLAVREFRAQVGRCDGLLISSPEYAHGIPGALKNALDWLVGSLEFPGAFVALINASPRSLHATAQLREVLSTMSARLVEPASITLDLSGPSRTLEAAGIAADPALSGQLRKALEAFVAVIDAARAEVD